MYTRFLSPLALCAIILTGPAVFTQERQQFQIQFGSLSDEELGRIAADPEAFVLAQLLSEADRRKIDPAIREYLKASFAAWRRKLGEHRDAIAAAKKYNPSILHFFAETKDSFFKERYFAEVTDKEAAFGKLDIDGEVLQVIDGGNLLASVSAIGGEEKTTVWLSKVDTSGFVDGSDLGLVFFAPRLWSIREPKSYTNALGVKRTVLHFEQHPLSVRKVVEHIDLFMFGRHWVSAMAATEAKEIERMEAKAARKAEAERLARFRTWSDASGRFSVQAEFRGFAAGVVKLRKMDGKEISVPLERLSPEDQEFVREKFR